MLFRSQQVASFNRNLVSRMPDDASVQWRVKRGPCEKWQESDQWRGKLELDLFSLYWSSLFLLGGFLSRTTQPQGTVQPPFIVLLTVAYRG